MGTPHDGVRLTELVAAISLATDPVAVEELPGRGRPDRAAHRPDQPGTRRATGLHGVTFTVAS